jgi:folylpolyglutamate synthase/dihydropteroate synthase
MAVLDFLEIPLDGLKSFFWPCRMESFVLNDVTVVLDGCHNDDSTKLFLLGLKEKYSDCKLLVLFGAGMEKYLNDMLRHVFDHADSVLMVQSRHFKSLSEIDLVAATSESQKCLLQHCISKDIVDKANNDMITTNDIIFSPLPRRDEGTISERLNWAIEHSRSHFNY